MPVERGVEGLGMDVEIVRYFSAHFPCLVILGDRDGARFCDQGVYMFFTKCVQDVECDSDGRMACEWYFGVRCEDIDF